MLCSTLAGKCREKNAKKSYLIIFFLLLMKEFFRNIKLDMKFLFFFGENFDFEQKNSKNCLDKICKILRIFNL